LDVTRKTNKSKGIYLNLQLNTLTKSQNIISKKCDRCSNDVPSTLIDSPLLYDLLFVSLSLSFALFEGFTLLLTTVIVTISLVVGDPTDVLPVAKASLSVAYAENFHGGFSKCRNFSLH